MTRHTRFHLADTLWALGREKERARQLASGALEDYRRGGVDYEDVVAEIREWFRERGLRPAPG